VQIGGKIAGVSQRLVESSAKSLTRQGLQALERQIAATLAAVSAPVAAASEMAVAEPAAASATERVGAAMQQAAESPAWQPVTTRRTVSTAAPGAGSSGGTIMLTTARDVASDLASDSLSPAQQERAIWAAVGALGMLLFVVLVRLVQKR
ncbi:MAG: hypothetical protein ACRC1H_16170, partial [Caldilineaceae bacterium]